MNIETRIDQPRGCGWRKPGGIYLVCPPDGTACGRLPIPLTVCPCCHAGIKPTRGWTWVDGFTLASNHPCSQSQCGPCPLAHPDIGKVGLLWIGEAFYPTPGSFDAESNRLGISRRISKVPRSFILGQDWVWLAHRKCIPLPDGSFQPGIFRVFKPTAVEYVVRGDESPEELEALSKRGITPVRIERIAQPRELTLALSAQ